MKGNMRRLKTYVVEGGTRVSERNDLDRSILSLLNQPLWNIHLRAKIPLSGHIVKLWSKSDVEGGDFVAESQVNGVVSPCMTKVESNRSSGQWPLSTVGGHAGNVGAWEDVLIGSFGMGVAAHFWIGDAEVGGCGGGECREGGDGGEGFHYENVGEIIEEVVGEVVML